MVDARRRKHYKWNENKCCECWVLGTWPQSLSERELAPEISTIQGPWVNTERIARYVRDNDINPVCLFVKAGQNDGHFYEFWTMSTRDMFGSGSGGSGYAPICMSNKKWLKQMDALGPNDNCKSDSQELHPGTHPGAEPPLPIWPLLCRTPAPPTG